MALVGKASASYWLGDNTTDRILDSFDAGGFEMPIALMVRGNSSIFRGRYEDGIASLHLAIANESGMSNLSYWNATLALGYYCLGDFGKALVTVTASQEFGTQYWLGHLLGSSFKCNTQSPLGIGCCNGHTKQAPQQRGPWRDISRA